MLRRQILNNLFLAGGLFLLQPSTVHAAEVNVNFDRDRQVYNLSITGRLLVEDVVRFIDLANAIPEGSKVDVVLQSSGGTMRGLEIGYLIHKRKFRTIALNECSSLCSWVWLAGVPRASYPDTRIGFHAAAEKCNKDAICEQVSAGGNALVGAYLNQLGFGKYAIWYMTSTDFHTMAWLTPADAAKYDITYANITFDGKVAQR